jgi:ribonuclease HI
VRQLNQNIHQDELWVKPPPSSLKCNVDCALFNNNTITELDICFRDSSGTLRYGLSKYSLYTSSHSEAEALSFLEALTFAVNQGMESVIFESDCKLVVDATISTSSPLNEFGDIISRCKTLLPSHSNYYVSYVRRQANRVAHNIARAAPTFSMMYLTTCLRLLLLK